MGIFRQGYDQHPAVKVNSQISDNIITVTAHPDSIFEFSPKGWDDLIKGAGVIYGLQCLISCLVFVNFRAIVRAPWVMEAVLSFPNMFLTEVARLSVVVEVATMGLH